MAVAVNVIVPKHRTIPTVDVPALDKKSSDIVGLGVEWERGIADAADAADAEMHIICTN